MQDQDKKDANSVEQQNKKIALKGLLIVVGMFLFGYALVPIYDIICDVTGLNGKTGVIEKAEVTGPDLSREITVKFTGSLASGAPFEFKPEQATMTVNPGGLYDTRYVAKNLTPAPIVAQATPSVSPREASLYFNKTECFCFTRQEFKPGEKKDMPVQFIIDRDIPDHVKSVVLSYTFFETKE